MQDAAGIQWGAIGLFGSLLLGWLAIHLLMQWQEHKRRRLARGFRNMKSTAHHQRERARRAKWGDHAGTSRPGAIRVTAKGEAGWR
jgi:hypothetical protein